MTVSWFQRIAWARRQAALTLVLSCILTPCGWCQAQPKAEIRTPPAIDLAKARADGGLLVSNLLSQAPIANSVTRGTMKIRNDAGATRQVPFTHEMKIGDSGWKSIYSTDGPEGVTLHIDQALLRTNRYELASVAAQPSSGRTLRSAETMVPFAGSDFWIADLGLEFLHWPEQRVVNTEMRRGQSCRVLESINLDPQPGAYSRVLSWIDLDSGGIVHADAFDERGELIKQFDPKEFKKVDGQWQLSEMEIRNRKTRSRTRIEFNLAPIK